MLIAQHLLACFMGGRWDSTAVGEARIPLKIKFLLSSQPTTTFPLATKKQSAKGAYFDGGDFGCLQTEITYNKKTQGKNLASDFWGGRWDSNPRPSEPQSVTLTD